MPVPFDKFGGFVVGVNTSRCCVVTKSCTIEKKLVNTVGFCNETSWREPLVRFCGLFAVFLRVFMNHCGLGHICPMQFIGGLPEFPLCFVQVPQFSF